jgi:diamine N-acetyltransferase|tara:strand:- start:668 stop:1162 length:495 start_codon:yes stop_codon:yes gene_type:complete
MHKTKELFLRSIEKKDAFGVYLWELDKETQRVTQSEIKVSLENVYALIEQQTDVHNSSQLRMMICLSSNNASIGMVDLYDVDFEKGSAYVGVLIAEKQQRKKGFARQALLSIAQYAKKELKLVKLKATIQSSNEASIALFESLDYLRSGEKTLDSSIISFELAL